MRLQVSAARELYPINAPFCTLVAQFAANVSPEHMGTLLDAVTELAANPAEGAVVAWDEVLASLANQ